MPVVPSFWEGRCAIQTLRVWVLLLSFLMPALLLLRGCVTADEPAQPEAQVYEDRFESGPILDAAFWKLDQLAAPALAVVQPFSVREGRNALGVTVRSGDLTARNERGEWTERSQIADARPLETGRQEWFAFSLLIPTDIPRSTERLELAEWRQDCIASCDRPLPAAVVLGYDKGSLYLAIAGDRGLRLPFRFPPQLDIRGQWVDLVFLIRLSKGGVPDGRVQMWFNDRRVVDTRGEVGFSFGTHTGQVLLGVRRTVKGPKQIPQQVFFDHYRRGENPSEVGHWISHWEKNGPAKAGGIFDAIEGLRFWWLLPKPQERVLASETIRVLAGNVYDGRGALHSWGGPGDCSQTEGQAPMFIVEEGAVLRNVVIEWAPDGVHVTGPGARVENVVFADVCEDAITIFEKATRVVLKENVLRFCADKGIQINGGAQTQVIDNVFLSCAKPIRLKPGARQTVVKGNTFWRSQVVVKTEGDSSAVFSGNTVFDARELYNTELGGSFSDRGRNRFASVGGLPEP